MSVPVSCFLRCSVLEETLEHATPVLALHLATTAGVAPGRLTTTAVAVAARLISIALAPPLADPAATLGLLSGSSALRTARPVDADHRRVVDEADRHAVGPDLDELIRVAVQAVGAQTVEQGRGGVLVVVQVRHDRDVLGPLQHRHEGECEADRHLLADVLLSLGTLLHSPSGHEQIAEHHIEGRLRLSLGLLEQLVGLVIRGGEREFVTRKGLLGGVEIRPRVVDDENLHGLSPF